MIRTLYAFVVLTVVAAAGCKIPSLVSDNRNGSGSGTHVYDYSFNWGNGPGASNQHVTSIPRFFHITNGAILSTDGQLQGTVLDGFGNVRFTGPCPVGSGNATFTGSINGGQGMGSYTCESNGYSNSWHVYNGD